MSPLGDGGKTPASETHPCFLDHWQGENSNPIRQFSRKLSAVKWKTNEEKATWIIPGPLLPNQSQRPRRAAGVGVWGVVNEEKVLQEPFWPHFYVQLSLGKGSEKAYRICRD